MISELFTTTVLVGILTSGFRLATPYLFASIGEMFGQRSGVYNLGVEGMMLMGAFAAFYVTFTTGNPWLGLLASIVVGAIMGLAMAVISVTLQAEQGISGIGVYLFGLGMSDLLFQRTLGTVETVQGFQAVKIPLLGDIPFIGPILFQQSMMVYIAYLLVPIAWYVMYRTTLGLKIRAVGENPAAADALGVSVTRTRYATVTLGGMLAGVAGASLSIALLNVFQQNLTSGIGFIAVALVYFGGWRPYGVLFGALLFSMVNALQLWIQALNIPIPGDASELLIMMPYVLTILVLIVAAGRMRKPAALGVPYERGT
ncbi:ABC uptake transporter, permease protein [Candidatus Promineifilum breve]|uniref:ABC uptake transporter, permease protein n=1 Tax=Candidatus Promineifilum breve TaxID=1806508 RepID=A0A170PFH0_9CHLR|nr:ABC transporter permease [Candidatus Promineifilum breve]CUS03187.2 ABC uptake transporter, permease protein [Candidatus Promineifilum breve]